MARLKEQYWVSKKDQTLAGQKASVGQLVRPGGSANDRRVFGDDTYWTYRYDGSIGDAMECGTDGCDALFINIGVLDRHRKLVHGPEREGHLRAKLEARQSAAEAEERGETIGGREIVMEKAGPRGAVPYIAPVG